MKKQKRAFKYVGVGLFLTLLNFCIYNLLAKFIINNNDLLWLATLISSTICVIVAYFMHKGITWKERDPGKIGIIKFFVWNGLEALLLNPFLTWFFCLFKWLYEFSFNICQAIGLPFDYDFVESTGAFVLMTIVTMILNYIFYDKFIFGEKAKDDEHEK